ncbi:MAG TPA: hypothetical protein O0X32_01725 [Methanocorpusculum sp.]|nr:hypothetical protein [Methanocorpusculum sp.]
MADKRTLTVSVTINLGNYENLKLEVTDTAETLVEAGNLRKFLADVLDGYGNNSATAKFSIDKYKERILAEKDAEVSFEVDTPEPVSVPKVEELGNEDILENPMLMSFDEQQKTKETISTEPVKSPDIIITPNTVVVSEPSIETSQPPQNLVAAPIHESQTYSEFVCSKCGAPVTKMQYDVSMLFNHKILCKDCMK